MQALRLIDITLRRKKKPLIIVSIAIFSIIYIIPFIYRSIFSSSPNSHDDSTSECIENFLRSYRHEILSSDASVWIPHKYRSLEVTPTSSFIADSPDYDHSNQQNKFYPVIGNGKFTIAPIADSEQDRRFHIRGKRTLDIAIPFDPIVTYDNFGTHEKSVSVTRYRSGAIEKCTCVAYAGGVTTIHETFTAHRLIPTLFTQSVRISNPTNVPIILGLKRKGWLNKLSHDDKIQKMLVTTADNRDYSIHIGRVHEKNFAPLYKKKKEKEQAVAIGYPYIHETIEIRSRSQGDLLMQTFLNYTTLFEHESEMEAAIPDIKVRMREVAKKIVNLSPATLYLQNTAAWEWLWSTGFRLSHSHAPNAINSQKINSTLFYLMIQRSIAVPTDFGSNIVGRPIPDLLSLNDEQSLTTPLPADSDTKWKQMMKATQGCYNGHSTFHAPKLWESSDSLSSVQAIASLWFLTLERQSCEHLINSDVLGVQQAFLYSLLDLRNSGKHIEFRANPADLQRDFLARQLKYGSEATFNLSVSITDDNKAIIQVSLVSLHNHVFYACDAGCLDSPVRLQAASPQIFPVKLTEPLTSLLYITSDREHITELKHSIHVKEVNEAPAHEHHTIAIHKYGHSLGGLPTVFWVSILLLIVAFHFFLGKLIYNEYINNNDNNYRYDKLNSGRYSM